MKKAQAQIITTILIILLVLAAIVIVWQVVRGVVTEGGEEVEKGATCLGVAMEIEEGPRPSTYVVKRSGGGEVFDTAEVTLGLVWIVNGESGDSSLDPNHFASPLASIVATQTAATSIEVALVVDGTTCPITGKWEA